MTLAQVARSELLAASGEPRGTPSTSACAQPARVLPARRTAGRRSQQRGEGVLAASHLRERCLGNVTRLHSDLR